MTESRRVIPSWFRWQTGFSFFDEGGDLCVILGGATVQKPSILGSISIPGQSESTVLWDVKAERYGAVLAIHYDGGIILANFDEWKYSEARDYTKCRPLREVESAAGIYRTPWKRDQMVRWVQPDGSATEFKR